MSVYGKKIVIDGVEYVAVPEIERLTAKACAGCEIAMWSKACNKTMNTIDCRNNHCIFKKVTPKKKPGKLWDGESNLSRVFFKTETSWGANPATINGIPYLSPFEMMMSNQTILIDDKPCKIIDCAGECGPDSIKHIITFEQMPCQYVPIIRCSSDKYIVCLSESGNLAPSENPKQHTGELAATKEAQRLCKKHNQKFVVLKVVAEVEPEIQTKVTKR